MQRCRTFQVTVAGNRIELGRNNRASLVSIYAPGVPLRPMTGHWSREIRARGFGRDPTDTFPWRMAAFPGKADLEDLYRAEGSGSAELPPELTCSQWVKTCGPLVR